MRQFVYWVLKMKGVHVFDLLQNTEDIESNVRKPIFANQLVFAYSGKYIQQKCLLNLPRLLRDP